MKRIAATLGSALSAGVATAMFALATLTLAAGPAAAQMRQCAYVATFNPQAVVVLDIADNRITDTIPLHEEARGYVPRALAVSPDGRRLYLASTICQQRFFPCDTHMAGHGLIAIDTASHTVVATAPFSGSDIVLERGGGRAFIPEGRCRALCPAITGGRVRIVRLGDLSLDDILFIPTDEPEAVALGPRDGTLYVAGTYLHLVDTWCPDCPDLVTVPLGRTLTRLALHRSGEVLYAGGEEASFAFSTATHDVIEVLPPAVDIAASPQGYPGYLVDRHSAGLVDVFRNEFVDFLPRGPRDPYVVEFSPDGEFAYVGGLGFSIPRQNLGVLRTYTHEYVDVSPTMLELQHFDVPGSVLAIATAWVPDGCEGIATPEPTPTETETPEPTAPPSPSPTPSATAAAVDPTPTGTSLPETPTASMPSPTATAPPPDATASATPPEPTASPSPRPPPSPSPSPPPSATPPAPATPMPTAEATATEAAAATATATQKPPTTATSTTPPGQSSAQVSTRSSSGCNASRAPASPWTALAIVAGITLARCRRRSPRTPVGSRAKLRRARSWSWTGPLPE